MQLHTSVGSWTSAAVTTSPATFYNTASTCTTASTGLQSSIDDFELAMNWIIDTQIIEKRPVYFACLCGPVIARNKRTRIQIFRILSPFMQSSKSMAGIESLALSIGRRSVSWSSKRSHNLNHLSAIYMFLRYKQFHLLEKRQLSQKIVQKCEYHQIRRADWGKNPWFFGTPPALKHTHRGCMRGCPPSRQCLKGCSSSPSS